MDIAIDFNWVNDLMKMKPWEVAWFIFSHGGWIYITILFLDAWWLISLDNRQRKFIMGVKTTILAIDIPKDNEQSILAVEQFFAQLFGIYSPPTKWEQYAKGQFQLFFSLEVVSIEGYIQFLIRTPEKFRDMIEASIYAQYPEAEITEVEDYVNIIPNDVWKLDSEYELWGSELNFAKHSAYPIRTYREFEHGLSQTFVDPMSPLLEVMSKIGRGEMIALQIVIAPASDGWKQQGYNIVNKIAGRKVASKDRLSDKFINTTLSWLGSFSEAIYSIWGNIKPPKDDLPSLMLHLTPGEKTAIEMIQNKLAKSCFSTSFRLIYFAHKDVFKKPIGRNALVGAVNQFNTSDLNAFRGYTPLTTRADYFFIKRRISWKKRKLVKLFKYRSRMGSREFYMSTEELATVYHFPSITVKAPLLKRTEWKKAEPPGSLPFEVPRESMFMRYDQSAAETPSALSAEATGPDVETRQVTLPIQDDETYKITESLPNYDFDNNYYEEKFVKGKKIVPDLEPLEDEKKNDEIPSNLPFLE